MKTEDRNYVCNTIDNEGFDYAFIDYSDFNYIKDEKFHELRLAYIKAVDDIKKYLKYKD